MKGSDVWKLLFWFLLIVGSVIGLVVVAESHNVSSLTELYQVFSVEQKLDRAGILLINLFIVIATFSVSWSAIKYWNNCKQNQAKSEKSGE